MDSTLIPTGEIAPVKGTPLDFTSPKPIGRDLLAAGGTPVGFDHNFCLDHPADVFSEAADVYEPVTGREMQVWTTQPGIQFYSGNFLDGSITGKKGVTYAAAQCLLPGNTALPRLHQSRQFPRDHPPSRRGLPPDHRISILGIGQPAVVKVAR